MVGNDVAAPEINRRPRTRRGARSRPRRPIPAGCGPGRRRRSSPADPRSGAAQMLLEAVQQKRALQFLAHTARDKTSAMNAAICSGEPISDSKRVFARRFAGTARRRRSRSAANTTTAKAAGTSARPTDDFGSGRATPKKHVARTIAAPPQQPKDQRHQKDRVDARRRDRRSVPTAAHPHRADRCRTGRAPPQSAAASDSRNRAALRAPHARRQNGRGAGAAGRASGSWQGTAGSSESDSTRERWYTRIVAESPKSTPRARADRRRRCGNPCRAGGAGTHLGLCHRSRRRRRRGAQAGHLFRPAIVVTDLFMPRMNGLQLLKALKDEGHLKVMMLTAQGSVESAVEAVKDGAEDYLTKPVDPQKLQAAPAAHRRAQRAEAREPSAAAAAAREGQLRPHRRQQPEACGRFTR